MPRAARGRARCHAGPVRRTSDRPPPAIRRCPRSGPPARSPSSSARRARGRAGGTARAAADKAAGHTQALSRGLAVLEALASTDGGATLTALAARLKIPAPTAHRLLATLEAAGYVQVRHAGRMADRRTRVPRRQRLPVASQPRRAGVPVPQATDGRLGRNRQPRRRRRRPGRVRRAGAVPRADAHEREAGRARAAARVRRGQGDAGGDGRARRGRGARAGCRSSSSRRTR